MRHQRLHSLIGVKLTTIIALILAALAFMCSGVDGQGVLPYIIPQDLFDVSNLQLSGEPQQPTGLVVTYQNISLINAASFHTGLQYTFDLITWQTLFTAPYTTNITAWIVSSNSQTFFRAENL